MSVVWMGDYDRTIIRRRRRDGEVHCAGCLDQSVQEYCRRCIALVVLAVLAVTVVVAIVVLVGSRLGD